jgi:rare lipoprotein A
MAGHCARRIAVAAVCAPLAFLAGCRHKQVASTPPPPPPVVATAPPTRPVPVSPRPGADASVIGQPPAGNPSDAAIVAAGKPVYSEEGVASWYGPPYNNRPGANGKIYDQNAMTAAHRTLPMNSLIRVTNLANGKSAVMRVTDRGPFVPGRTIDLSVASAKSIGVWLPGTARVRVDVFEAPKPIEVGGRWCVQVGAFQNAGKAHKLEDHLEHMYRTANVIEFTGPTGHWVRIRPQNDDKSRAVEIARTMSTGEDGAKPYLVRLD